MSISFMLRDLACSLHEILCYSSACKCSLLAMSTFILYVTPPGAISSASKLRPIAPKPSFKLLQTSPSRSRERKLLAGKRQTGPSQLHEPKPLVVNGKELIPLTPSPSAREPEPVPIKSHDWIPPSTLLQKPGKGDCCNCWLVLYEQIARLHKLEPRIGELEKTRVSSS